ncbi:delta(3,5)-Delta(2,4)-dienoyl-CoA isomerase, mitochondrial [Leptidea sinapis]|uniref:delta(3,5)-Delta(2,4)-dienoyl-CoA isomerase, mitochondrial n=1 Tax=Leptidea sinapis TaxID=189913 RepID=UPI00212C7FC8|nr:delta(3,5)-Delta(2,4)-dienoyl-CoA isomerase, mitochondrial [Leptidea sinapis]
MMNFTKSLNLLRPIQRYCTSIKMYSSKVPQFETLAVSVPKKYVYHVEMNRPQQINTFTPVMWRELNDCFSSLSANPECRVVVLSGRGKHFTGGIDFNSLIEMESQTQNVDDVARRARSFEKLITNCQAGITAIEDCVKPVLSMIHSACVGAGVDLVTAADMRYCTEDSWFQVKEVDLGLAADVGTLQRLPKVVGNTSVARELCFTARKLLSKEALEIGLVSKVFPDKESGLQHVMEIAETIAKKSPIAVQNTKISLVYSQSRPNKQGLEHISLINQISLQSEDLKKAAIAQATKTETEFDLH